MASAEIKVENKNEKYIIKMPPLDREPNPKGIGWFCFDSMKKYKDNVAQICTETGAQETYGTLLQKSIRTAIALKNRGITSSDIISVCTFNHLNSFVPIIAAQFLCRNAAAFDPTLSSDDTNYLMQQIKPKLIFITSNSVELIENAIKYAGCDTEIITFEPSSKYATFDEFLKPSREENSFEPAVPKSLKDTAMIFFSSGTTGLPKGICLTHYGLLGQIEIDFLQTAFCENILSFSSPYWISTTILLLSAIQNGKSRLILRSFIAENFWSITSKYKAEFVFMAPSQMFETLNVKPKHPDTTSIKYLLLGGSAISKEQMLNIGEQFPNTKLYQAYGLTEASGCVTVVNPSESRTILDEKGASCGVPIKGIDYKLVDVDTGEIVGPNKIGELWLKTELAMVGYYKKDSSDCWDKDGYFRTGDMLYYDEDKYFYHVDRIKEMFKYKSWHIQPNVIESVITQHPAVLKAVVIGIKHPEDGDHPMAIVTIKNGYENVTEEEIKKFTNDRVIDRQQLRAGLKIVSQIPLTPTGKIQRRMVRDLVLNNAL